MKLPDLFHCIPMYCRQFGGGADQMHSILLREGSNGRAQRLPSQEVRCNTPAHILPTLGRIIDFEFYFDCNFGFL